jgi:hypothetical protein
METRFYILKANRTKVSRIEQIPVFTQERFIVKLVLDGLLSRAGKGGVGLALFGCGPDKIAEGSGNSDGGSESPTV